MPGSVREHSQCIVPYIVTNIVNYSMDGCFRYEAEPPTDCEREEVA